MTETQPPTLAEMMTWKPGVTRLKYRSGSAEVRKVVMIFNGFDTDDMAMLTDANRDYQFGEYPAVLMEDTSDTLEDAVRAVLTSFERVGGESDQYLAAILRLATFGDVKDNEHLSDMPPEAYEIAGLPEPGL